MPTRLTYAIKFVADMDKAVAFYRDTLGLHLKFASPDWSEFITGETTLALHAANEHHPAGSVEIGFRVEDLEAFHREQSAAGLTFTQAPKSEHGSSIASFLDCEGAQVSVSG